jgi:hypothetical protein
MFFKLFDTAPFSRAAEALAKEKRPVAAELGGQSAH